MAREPTMIDDEGAALTDAELAEMRPARSVLTAEEFAAVSSVRKGARGRPPAVARKVPVTIRLDARIVDAFKAEGRGWQTRMNEALARVLSPEPVPSPRAETNRESGSKTGTGKRSQKL